MLKPCGERGINLTQEINKGNSIYVQLLRLLIVSAVISALLFRALDLAGMYFLDKSLYNVEYQEKKDRHYIEELQNYIDREDLSTDDTSVISEWVREQKILSIDIYKDGILIFNSDYPDQEVWEEEIALSDYEVSYEVEFADGMTQVIILGAYGYQFYNYVFIANLFVSFAVFLCLVLLGIRKKMHYISRLSEDIEILEGGSLDYAVTVKGRDELAVLAAGIDSMRRSFLEMREKEARMVRENQRIVTEMSHDLRTPVTSIMLYAEILKKETDEERQKKYIEIIEKKAYRMKQLTDNLFEYSLVTGEDEIELGQPESFETLFYDLFSETCSYLEKKGFQVDCQMEWPDKRIQISENYMMRIMDNITSNLIKYADASSALRICTVEKTNAVGFIVENHIRSGADKTESTGIGIQNIKNMMSKMDGDCTAETAGGIFRLTLLFPVV